MKKVVILSNHHSYTYNFRKEIIQRLIDEGYKVYVVLPYGEKVELLKEMGCEFIDLPLDRRGMNPLTDLKLLMSYNRIIKSIKPDVVLSYTIKPNLYGGLVCRRLKIPYIANVTGLGSAFEDKSLMKKFILALYMVAFKKINCIFFQNEENKNLFEKEKIALGKHKLIPGSGVNIDYFKYLDYPKDDIVEFCFISRIMKEKGIEEYIEVAKYIRNKYPNTKFHVLGFCEEGYESTLKELQERGIIEYHGMQNDIRKFHSKSHCTIHPTYYPEGMSNVLLESAACGRPIITTDRTGCREIVDNGVNGFIVNEQDSKDLIEKVEKFLKLDYEEKKSMGIAGRKKVEKEFNREIVVESYIKEIKKV